MKKYAYTLLCGCLAALPAAAEIEVSEQLTLSGFIDMSATSVDDVKSMSLDQAEVDFHFDMGDGLTARADIEGRPDTDFVLEQAFISYDMDNGVAITAGKFLSCSGWETAEPTGLYQFSTSATLVYGGYQHGVAASYGQEKFGLYGAVVSSVWDGTDTDAEEIGFEVQASLMPVEEVTAKVAFLSEDVGGFSTTLVNAWAAYFAGPLTVAGEVNLLSNWLVEDNDGTGFLVMANYALTDRVAVTGRFSSLDTDAMADAATEFTVSPSYAVTDNWSLLAEVRFDDDGGSFQSYAVESLLTF